MLLPEHKFLVEKVFQPESTQNNNHKYQRIVLKKPGFTDEFGEKKGKDDLFDCRVWNKKIDNVPPGLKAGDKVKVMLSLNGRDYLDESKNEIGYNLQLSIGKIELL